MLKLKPHPRSPNWYLVGSIRGKSISISTRTPVKAQAKIILKEWEKTLFQRSLNKSTQATFADAAMRYKREVGHRQQEYVKKLEGYFAGKLLSEIGQREVDAAAESLYPGTRGQTKNRAVYTPVNAIMVFAAQDGLITWGGLRRPRVREMPRDRWCSPDEAKAFLAHADSDLAGLFIFLLYTGARISEALGLDWKDVSLERRHISLPEFKTKKRRAVVLFDGPFTVLRKMDHREGFVFPWRVKERVYPAWRACCKAAGLEGITPHTMRHSFATWLLLYGKLTLHEIGQRGGWKDSKSTERYSHLSSEGQLEVGARLPKVVG